MLGAQRRDRTDPLEQGDVGHIPQGCGHLIENFEGASGRLLIGLNTGIYKAISRRMDRRPVADVIVTNLGEPAGLFEKCRHRRGSYRTDGTAQFSTP
ncbi:MAG: oxdD [Planctomycetota bacterium]|nr:oxdD [Planctomycetota bacterium]